MAFGLQARQSRSGFVTWHILLPDFSDGTPIRNTVVLINCSVLKTVPQTVRLLGFSVSVCMCYVFAFRF